MKTDNKYLIGPLAGPIIYQGCIYGRIIYKSPRWLKFISYI